MEFVIFRGYSDLVLTCVLGDLITSGQSYVKV